MVIDTCGLTNGDNAGKVQSLESCEYILAITDTERYKGKGTKGR